MKVSAIPAFRDNYIWAIHDDCFAVLVDPGDAAPILAWLAAHHIRPIAILITHHHADHVDGIRDILSAYPIPVYAPAKEAIPGRSHPIENGELLHFPELDLAFAVLATPGHTLGHVCYFGHGALFCGDTLFSCGCGRLFEGTATEMHASLGRIMALPPETLVYCAHEYTLANLAFALEVEPDNPALHERLAEARRSRALGQPTLPVSLGREFETNPFLRCDYPAVVVAASRHFGRTIQPGVATFAAVRAWKDAP